MLLYCEGFSCHLRTSSLWFQTKLSPPVVRCFWETTLTIPPPCLRQTTFSLTGRPHPPSDVAHIEGPHQQVQVPDVGGPEQLGTVHHGDGDTQGGPDVGRHLLVAAALTPPLLVQSCQEVTDRLPAGPGPAPDQLRPETTEISGFVY